MVKENTSISGQRMAARMIIMKDIWTLLTSVVRRVTREEGENLSMLAKE